MNILGATLTQLIKAIKARELSSEELVRYFAKRYDKFDKELNCFITYCKQEPKSQSSKEALCGVPLAIKDNIITKDIETTAASEVLKDYIPPYDATVVTRLKDAGANILGKTNLDAWAHGSSTETSDFGSTKNPHDSNRVPGGSSGGSAAAVASYLVPAALGTETGGSVRQPASWCGVVGLKPTYGRSSRYGLIAMASSFDCPGALTRSVEDAALLLAIIAGGDPYDATTSNKSVPNYVKSLKGKKTFTIGVPDDYFDGVDSEIVSAVNESLALFENKGHKVKKIKLTHPKYVISVYTVIQRAEVSSNLARFDGIRYGQSRSHFGEEAKRRIMLGAYTLAHGYYDEYYKKAQKVRSVIMHDFDRIFKEVDMIVSPTTPVTALKLGEYKKYPFFGELMDSLNEPASIAGLPGISIPVGKDKKGLPIGMQIISRAFDEETMLSLAYQYEQETGFGGVLQVPEKFR